MWIMLKHLAKTCFELVGIVLEKDQLRDCYWYLSFQQQIKNLELNKYSGKSSILNINLTALEWWIISNYSDKIEKRSKTNLE